MNLAVIGGGYAGMAAAVTLAAQNIPVTVFESAPQLGGRARGLWHKDTQLDNGQHILLGCYYRTLQLIEQTGGNIHTDFVRLPLQLTLHDIFKLKVASLPAPLHLLLGLLMADGLSFNARMRAIRFMLAMRRSRFKLTQDMSALALLKKYQQDELVRLLWEPLCIAALNTPLSQASAQVLLNVLRDSLNGPRTASNMLLPRVDLSTLFPDRAASYIKQHGGSVLTSCAVQTLTQQGAHIELTTSRGSYYFSHVICAAAPAAAARLLRSLPQMSALAEHIDHLPHQPIYTVYLQYPSQVHLPQPMLGFHDCISQWLFDKGQIAGQHGLIAAVISTRGIHQDLTHEQLAHTVIREIRTQLDIAAAPLWHQVIAEKRATFSCQPHLLRPAHVTPLANVLLAGDYTAGEYPATLEGAVLSGVRCAEHITEKPPGTERKNYHE